MTRRAIRKYPENVLLQSAEEVDLARPDLKLIVSDMIESMYAAGGIGLAAPQIGIPLRIFVMDLSRDGKARPEVFINPVLEPADDAKKHETEGCLSLPGASAAVPRWSKVRLTAYNLQGERYEGEAEGLRAACFQHECDHLDGRLYISHLSHAKRQRVIKQFRKCKAKPSKVDEPAREQDTRVHEDRDPKSTQSW